MSPRLSISTCLCMALSLGFGCGKSEVPVARANGQPITAAQWDAYVKLKHLNVENPERRATALDGYVARVGLTSAIESEKLLDDAVTRAEFEEAKSEWLINRYFKKFLDDKITDAEVEAYYNSHLDDYKDQKVHVAQILLVANPRTEEVRKARLAAAQTAYLQVQGGKPFAEVASAVSDDKTSGKNGGDLGWLRPGSATPVLIKRALELKPGEVSEPFESPLGVHVIKVLEPIDNSPKPLRLVQAEIRSRLRTEAKATETERLIAKANIEIDGKPRREAKEQTSSASAATDKPNVAAR